MLVSFTRGATGEQRASLRRLAGVRQARRVGPPGLELLKLPPGQTRAAIARLRRSGRVAYAEPNRIYRVAELPNDPLFGELWGLHNTGQRTGYLTGTPDADIDAPEAWQRAGPTSPVTVAVVDTGVDAEHPDIASQLARNPGNGEYGYDFVSEDRLPEDQNGHGTHVAATIAARGGDGFGVVGVAPQARIMALRALDAEGAGEADDIASAFYFAAQYGAKIVNASFSGGPSQAISDAISAAPDVLFVAAAGNSGADLDDGSPRFPCAYTHVNLICVGATDRNDRRAWYSSYGQASVDLAAPGSEVVSAFTPQRTALQEGFEGSNWRSWSFSGHWRRTAEAAAAGGFGLAHPPGGPYASRNEAVSDWIDLSGLSNCHLSFALDIDIEGDYGDLMVEYEAAAGGELVDAFSSDWRETVIRDLPGGKPVRLKFTMRTDGAWNDSTVVSDDRVFIDDVAIRCQPGTRDPQSFERLSGTSMATPHVVGAAALLWGSDPAASLVRVRCALLEGVDRIDGFAQLMSTGGRLNAAGALAAPPPDPPQPRSGTIETAAGSAATLDKPAAVAVRGAEMLIADTWNHRIRRVGADGVITTVAGTGDATFSGDGGPATSARLSVPMDVDYAADGGLLIADTYNDRIRRVAPDGTIDTVAGSEDSGYGGDGGAAVGAQLDRPEGVAALTDGGFLIADTRNNRIRRVSRTGVITTVAGNGQRGFSGDRGPATDAELFWPRDVAPTPDGGFLVADTRNNRVRKVNPDGTIVTLAGSGKAAYSGDHGDARFAAVYEPVGLAVRADGSFLVTERSGRVREVDTVGTIRTLAGTDANGFSGDGGPAILARLDAPYGIAVTSDGFVLADVLNNRIRRVSGPLKDVDTLPRACQRAPTDSVWTPPAAPAAQGQGPGTPGGPGPGPGPVGGPLAPPSSSGSQRVALALRALARSTKRALTSSGARAFSKRGVIAHLDAPEAGRLAIRLFTPRRARVPAQTVGTAHARVASAGRVALALRPTRRGRALLRRPGSTRLGLVLAWVDTAGTRSAIRATVRLAP